jgi:hypothetical protein
MPAVEPVTSARLPLSPRSMVKRGIGSPPFVVKGERSWELGAPTAV